MHEVLWVCEEGTVEENGAGVVGKGNKTGFMKGHRGKWNTSDHLETSRENHWEKGAKCYWEQDEKPFLSLRALSQVSQKRNGRKEKEKRQRWGVVEETTNKGKDCSPWEASLAESESQEKEEYWKEHTARQGEEMQCPGDFKKRKAKRNLESSLKSWNMGKE